MLFSGCSMLHTFFYVWTRACQGVGSSPGMRTPAPIPAFVGRNVFRARAGSSCARPKVLFCNSIHKVVFWDQLEGVELTRLLYSPQFYFCRPINRPPTYYQPLHPITTGEKEGEEEADMFEGFFFLMYLVFSLDRRHGPGPYHNP